MSDRPRRTVFPVMAAVNTWPSARKLMASTHPEVMVNAMSKMLRIAPFVNVGNDLSVYVYH